MKSKFLKFLELQEMATLHPKEHNFDVDVKIHLYQECDRKMQHSARLKIFKKGVNGSFSISVNDKEKIVVVGDWSKFVSEHDLEQLKRNAIHYKVAILNYCCNQNMSKEDLLSQMEEIDRGYEIEKEYKR